MGRDRLLILGYGGAAAAAVPGGWPRGELHGCEFTSERARLPEAHAVLFRIPGLGVADDPPRYAGQRWVLWSMESAAHHPRLADPRFMRQFDVVMSHRRNATIWTPYLGPETAAELLAPPQPKTAPAAAVYLQSSGFDRSGRVEYVRELMKRVKVASFGGVLNNQGGARIGPAREAKLALLAPHRFTLAFENAIEPDYVTEKLFDPLVAGSVPVYLGAPNAGTLAPAPGCFIDAAGFRGPAALADYLNHLVADERAYAEYLAWKARGLSPGFLALVSAVAAPPLERLCDRLRETMDAGWRPRGRPSYPLRAAWHRRLARRVLPAGVRRWCARRRGRSPT